MAINPATLGSLAPQPTASTSGSAATSQAKSTAPTTFVLYGSKPTSSANATLVPSNPGTNLLQTPANRLPGNSTPLYLTQSKGSLVTWNHQKAEAPPITVAEGVEYAGIGSGIASKAHDSAPEKVQGWFSSTPLFSGAGKLVGGLVGSAGSLVSAGAGLFSSVSKYVQSRRDESQYAAGAKAFDNQVKSLNASRDTLVATKQLLEDVKKVGIDFEIRHAEAQLAKAQLQYDQQYATLLNGSAPGNAGMSGPTHFAQWDEHVKATKSRDGAGIALQAVNTGKTLIETGLDVTKQVMTFLAKGKALVGSHATFVGKAIPGVNIGLGIAGAATAAVDCRRKYVKHSEISQRMKNIEQATDDLRNTNASQTGRGQDTAGLAEALDNVSTHAGVRLGKNSRLSILNIASSAISVAANSLVALGGALSLTGVGLPVGVVMTTVAGALGGLTGVIAAGQWVNSKFSDRVAEKLKAEIKDPQALQDTLDKIKTEHQLDSDEVAKSLLAKNNRFFAVVQLAERIHMSGDPNNPNSEVTRAFLSTVGMSDVEITQLQAQVSAETPLNVTSPSVQRLCALMYG